MEGFARFIPTKYLHANNVFHSGATGWKQTLAELSAGYNSNGAKQSAIGASTIEWQKIYEDPIARIFIRKSDPPSPWLKNFQDQELIRNNTMMSEEFP